MTDSVDASEGEGPPKVPRGTSRRSVLMLAAAATLGAATLGGATRANAASNLTLPSYPESGPPAGARSFSVQAAGDYPNGQIPTSELTYVGDSTTGLGKQYLLDDAAAAFSAMAVEFRGAIGHSLTMAEAYRDLDRQQYLYDGYKAGKPGFNLAATPGTSVHGLGRAVDFSGGVNSYGTAEKNWMNANGPRFGWQPRGDGFSPREPWHFEYDGSWTGSTDTGEDDMFKLIHAAENDTVFIVGPAARAPISSPSHLSLLQRFQKQDKLLTVEIDICLSYIRKVY
ncbi:M15 family metallopeptidase [Curtobacterium sp. 9128]|uniref:M15 family metallopeptidase n=1 Tax=Curtobacterium sp. 9128 TaxID=1793722 RepID=UPI0021B32EC7|nr:M15 family metallopeptidase [Curtobacterium sp. 9128]